MRTAVYGGSFDPLTIGHMEILQCATGLFDKIYIAVLRNADKSPLFTAEERQEMIKGALAEAGIVNASAVCFDGLLADFARQVGATHSIRGLRAVTDFEYEFQIHAVNRHLAPEIQTVYFMANPAHSFLSSSHVKEIALYGGSIEGLVPSCNKKIITERLSNT